MTKLGQMIAAAVVPAVLLGVSAAQEPAQNPPARPQGDAGQRGGGRMMRGTGGTISAISGDTITLKTFNGQETVVKISDKTQFRKDQKEAKASDFKAGDLVIVRGEQNSDGSWAAQTVISRSDIAQFAGGGQGGGRMMVGTDSPAAQAYMAWLSQGMGKDFIVGTIKEINGTKLTIDRLDKVSQTIEVDENTSFRMSDAQGSSQSVTLADVKPGFSVVGCGALNKDNVFVPTSLGVSQAGLGGAVVGVGQCRNLRPPQK